MPRFSHTYAMILDLLFKTDSIRGNNYSTTFENGSFKRTRQPDTTQRITQEIVIADATLFSRCTPAQWWIVGNICSELKAYNALWQCSSTIKRSGNSMKAIKALIQMQVLIKTETPHIYLVNPLYIRRGDFHSVLLTTANMLSNVPKVLPEHITNKKALREYQVPQEALPQTGYGFAEIPIANN